VFPNPEALLRLAGAVLVEAHDEWQVSDRRYLSEGWRRARTDHGGNHSGNPVVGIRWYGLSRVGRHT
jgi:hypothetical protein